MRNYKLLVLFVMLGGCYHATLDPVSPNASAQERIAAYNRLRPEAQVEDITVTANKYGASVTSQSSVVLADGTTVSDPEDLLPVLDPATPAARAAQRSADAHHTGWMWLLGGMVAIAGGGTLALIDLSSSSDNYNATTDTYERSSHVLSLVGLGAMVFGTFAATIGPMYYGSVARREGRAAFVTYDASLRQSLRLCVDGLQITDCAAPPSQQSPVQAAAQAAR